VKPRVAILHATGTNRDREAAWACELAGAAPEIIHMNQLAAGEKRLADYRMAILPGGFSYGDDLGAGKLWAVSLRHRLAEALAEFVEAGKPVLGICNGFQALVKAGLLPGAETSERSNVVTFKRSNVPTVTLTRNDSGRFECRWVYLAPQPASPCVFTRGLAEPIYCPVAHGEGKFVAADADTLADLEVAGLVALRYSVPRSSGHRGPDGEAGYPGNPNGSQADIAGICNARGTVLGLMPHPEDHIVAEQHPRFHAGARGMSGLPLFQNGVRYAAGL
jgi:phosphoribosylformylglycinamidine synthase I